MTPFAAFVLAAAAAAADAPGAVCPPDWESARRSDCWVRTGMFGSDSWAYVHRRGWAVDQSCFHDSRFSGRELLVALDAAWRKMSPDVPVSAGGCLSEYNPQWARAFADAPWRRHMYLGCGSFDPLSSTCATHEARDAYKRSSGPTVRLPRYYRVLRVVNYDACRGPMGTGLAGLVFHETLHGDDVDNEPVENHNEAWKRPQYKFIYDRVYAAEAVCFLGQDARRERVNVVQCRQTVAYNTSEPRQELCDSFPASFTDLPAGFFKH